jgi:DNA/RNA endonuclease YhcR with UshA esterase domain
MKLSRKEQTMRLLPVVSVFCLLPLVARADDNAKPITPAEAAKKIDQKCSVEMKVKSVGKAASDGPYFLNSEDDFRSDNNFTIFVSKEVVAKLKEAKIDDPITYYKDKTIRVTGTVTKYRDKPQIKVEGADQIKVVDKK